MYLSRHKNTVSPKQYIVESTRNIQKGNAVKDDVNTDDEHYR
jgi:hypothetical protein